MAQLETLEAKVTCSSIYVQIVYSYSSHRHYYSMNLNLPAKSQKFSEMKFISAGMVFVLCAWQFYLIRFNLFYIKIPFYSTHMNIRFNLCIFWNFYNNTLVHIIYSRIIARLHFQNQFLLFNLVFRSSYVISILFSAIYTKICYI